MRGWFSRIHKGDYFVGCFFLASARRSLFFRRFARFLELSLPLLCPIIPNTLLLSSNLKHQNSSETHSRHLLRCVISTKAGSISKATDVTWDEIEAGVSAVAAFPAAPVPAHPELWSLAHPALAAATWLAGQLPAAVPPRAC